MELPELTAFSSLAFTAQALLVGSGGALLGITLLASTPRVGPMRALALGLRSAITTTHPLSVRTAEVNALKKTLQSMQKGQFVTVLGRGTGDGKSCLVDTSLNRTFGVIKTSVSGQKAFIHSFIYSSF